MNDWFDPNQTEVSLFQIYNFIPSLRKYAAHPALLPAKAFTCLELRPLASFIYTWF
jgi:hypothetical protein